ncbi:MAG: polysaccharide biosynthesis/export family protein [Calditrichaceae bacterium]
MMRTYVLMKSILRKSVFLISVVLLSFLTHENTYSQGVNPGDGVRVTFFNISDGISGDYFVQQDGHMQLPYIGLISARDRDFPSIRNEIITKYDSLYRNPELTIQPLYKINVLGEVRNPGLYYVTGVEKLTDLIAMAGGETSDTNLNGLYIIRENQEIKVNAKSIIEKGDRVSDIGLRSGDRVFVPRKWWVGARNAAVIISAAAVLVTLASLFIR